MLLIRLLRACEANSAEDNLMLRLLSSQVRFETEAGFRAQDSQRCAAVVFGSGWLVTWSCMTQRRWHALTYVMANELCALS